MPIPNWIVSIEEKAVRERALSLWADFQRAREKAQLEHQQVVRGAELLYDSTVSDAVVKRDRAIHKARDVYDRAKKSLLEAAPLKLVEKAH